METSLSKIVQYIKNSKEQIIIVSGQYEPHIFLTAVAEDATGLKYKRSGTLQEKLNSFKGMESEVKNSKEFPDGQSRFFCINTKNVISQNVIPQGMIGIQQKILSCVLEFEIKKIIVEPIDIMFKGVSGIHRNEWLIFKNGLEEFFGVEFILMKDDF